MGDQKGKFVVGLLVGDVDGGGKSTRQREDRCLWDILKDELFLARPQVNDVIARFFAFEG